MTPSFIRKRVNRLKRRLRKKAPSLAVALLVIAASILVYSGYMADRRAAVDPEAFEPLLELIAKAESNDNYNAYYGNPNNKSIDFTSMSIAEVLGWQEEFVAQGNPSSAVGRYQIINTTLEGLVREMEIDSSNRFDEDMQDKMAITLLERRGAEKYVNDEISKEDFAANLSMEWAALPRVVGDSPDDSYYSGDGLNKSRVRVSEILAVIDLIDI